MTHELVECGSEECWQHGSLTAIKLTPTPDAEAKARGIAHLDKVADYGRMVSEARQ